MKRIATNLFAIIGNRQFPILLLLSICALCALLIGNQACMKRHSPADPLASSPSQRRLPVDEESMDDGLNREDREGRANWFLTQRLYPFDSLPENARRNAFAFMQREQRRQAETRDGIALAATPAWQAIGPFPTHSAYFGNWGHTSGRINAVAVSPINARLILIGSATGGIWRSTNGGTTFTPVSDDQVDLAVGSIAFAQNNPSIVYAGMGDTKASYLGSGVLKSTDEGRSWSRVSNNSLPTPGTIGRLEVDPVNPNRLYVAQYSRLDKEKGRLASGLYVSNDGGVNWTKTYQGWARDVLISPTNRQVIYMGVANRFPHTDTQPSGLYRSTDSGQTWTSLLTQPFDPQRTLDVRVAVTTTNPQKLYAYLGGFIGSQFNLVLRSSTDDGATWADLNTFDIDFGGFSYNTYLAVDPTNGNTVYIGSRDIFKSTDGGLSWRNLNRNFVQLGAVLAYTPTQSNAHPDQHGFAFSPTNPNELLIGKDGGLYKSSDGGNTFQSLNSSLSLTQFVGITLHPTNPAITYGGTQDNGTQRRNSGSLWVEFADGDGGKTELSQTHPGIVLANYLQGYIFRYFENGTFFDRQVSFNSSFGEPERGARVAFYPPFTGNGIDDTLYFGTWRLFKSTDMGDGWTPPAGELDMTKGETEKGKDVLSAIAIARSNLNVIYTGSAFGRALVTTDGGSNWTDITAGLPDRLISGIAVDPNNPAIAYLCVSGFLSGHIFKTINMGATWTDISSGLPDIPANAVLVDPIDSSKIYLGTDIGVFRLTAASPNWQSFNKGMPPAIVSAFASQPTGLIQVSTYGRGAFEINTASERPAISNAVFNGKKKLDITGERFDNETKVIINGVDRSTRIRSRADSIIKLKGKLQQLGLLPGDNSIQVVDSDGDGSTIFILRIQITE